MSYGERWNIVWTPKVEVFKVTWSNKGCLFNRGKCCNWFGSSDSSKDGESSFTIGYTV